MADEQEGVVAEDNEEASAETITEQDQEALKEGVKERQRQKAEPGASAEQVTLDELQDSGGSSPSAEIDLNALIDVEVTLSVEIGRCRLPIKQLISLTQGSVVELDRAVDEPLDLLVNGTLIARGEVVVVDGQFGLRLVDVVSQSERLRRLS